MKEMLGLSSVALGPSRDTTCPLDKGERRNTKTLRNFVATVAVFGAVAVMLYLLRGGHKNSQVHLVRSSDDGNAVPTSTGGDNLTVVDLWGTNTTNSTTTQDNEEDQDTSTEDEQSETHWGNYEWSKAEHLRINYTLPSGELNCCISNGLACDDSTPLCEGPNVNPALKNLVFDGSQTCDVLTAAISAKYGEIDDDAQDNCIMRDREAQDEARYQLQQTLNYSLVTHEEGVLCPVLNGVESYMPAVQLFFKSGEAIPVGVDETNCVEHTARQVVVNCDATKASHNLCKDGAINRDLIELQFDGTQACDEVVLAMNLKNGDVVYEDEYNCQSEGNKRQLRSNTEVRSLDYVSSCVETTRCTYDYTFVGLAPTLSPDGSAAGRLHMQLRNAQDNIRLSLEGNSTVYDDADGKFERWQKVTYHDDRLANLRDGSVVHRCDGQATTTIHVKGAIKGEYKSTNEMSFRSTNTCTRTQWMYANGVGESSLCFMDVEYLLQACECWSQGGGSTTTQNKTGWSSE